MPTLEQLFIYLGEFFSIDSVWDVIRLVVDIAIVTYIFYKVLLVLKDSRAWQLMRGVLLVLIAAFISELIGMPAVSYVTKLFINLLPMLLIILFQPELRRWLEGIGRKPFTALFKREKNASKEQSELEDMISELVPAVFAMGREKVGALIVFERHTSLNEIIRTGTIVNASVSTQLTRLIFTPNTPLHDGAMIIRGNKIHAAACYLPLSDNEEIDLNLGTRHRAGIGITETTDALSLVVSEETGVVSICEAGKISRNMTPEVLRIELMERLNKDNADVKLSRHNSKKKVH